MARVTVDTSDLRAFAQDLGDASPRLAKDVRATMLRAAANIKRDLQDGAKGHRTFPYFWQSITYDSAIGVDEFTAEIGPDKDRTQGALGNILYFGTALAGPTLEDPLGALLREQPTLEAHLAQALIDAVIP